MKHMTALKNEFGVFLLVLLSAIVLVGSIYIYRLSLLEDSNYSADRLTSIQKKYQTAKNRQQLIQEYKDKFKLLKSNNIIGQEDRLNWIDSLDQIIKQEQIPYLKYDISQQKRFNDRKVLSRYPKIDVYISEMKLEMRLLHEGDLYTVINMLANNARGLFEVERCDIERSKIMQTSIVDSGTDSNFKATCSLNWYTFRPQDS